MLLVKLDNKQVFAVTIRRAQAVRFWQSVRNTFLFPTMPRRKHRHFLLYNLPDHFNYKAGNRTTSQDELKGYPQKLLKMLRKIFNWRDKISIEKNPTFM